mgnify:FL=1
MTNITLSLPDDLRKRMTKFNEIKWNEIARRSIEERLNDLEEMERIVSKSKLTKKDAEGIAEKIKKGIAKRHGLR